MKRLFAICLGVLFTAALMGYSAPALAAYPDKPVRFIIPFGAGGGADIEGRILAKEMSKILGVPFVPINKVGAGGAVTFSNVAGMTPATTYGASSSRIGCPTIVGSEAKLRRHRPSLRITTSGPPGLSAEASNPRPNAGATPRIEK